VNAPKPIRMISIIQPHGDEPMRWLVTFVDGSCQRPPIHPVHALRLAADLTNGAAFHFGKETEK
jgi:hypothetical protein